MKQIYWIGFVGACGIAGCVPTSQRTEWQPPEGSRWTQLEESAPITWSTRWWEVYQDPMLDSWLEHALNGHPDLASIRQQVIQAEALLAEAEGSRLPDANVSLSASRGFTPDGAGGRAWANQYRAGLGLSWVLDVFGQRSAQIDAVAYQLEASYQRERAARQVLVAQVVRSRIAEQAARRQLAIVRRQLVLQQQLTDILHRRFEKGSVTAGTLRSARENLCSTQAMVPVAEQQWHVARHALAVSLGETPQTLSTRWSDFPDMPSVDMTELLPGGGPVELLLSRPDLGAAQAQVEAAWSRTKAAEKAFYPTLSLSGEIGVQDQRWSDLWDADQLAGQLLAQLLAPLDLSGEMSARHLQAQSELNVAVNELASAWLRAVTEVEDALVAQRAQKERLHWAKQQADEAQAAYQLILRELNQGRSTAPAALEASRRQLSAQRAVVEAEQAWRVSRVALALAWGGEWDLSFGTPSKEHP